MRNLLFPLLFLLFFLPLAAGAQRFLGAVSAGMNLTQVDGDEFYGFHKVGINAGPMVAMPFGKNRNWSVSMELLYSQKGSRHRGSTDSTDFKLVQDYAEIPVLLHFTDKNRVSAGVGVSYGQLVNYEETRNQVFDSLFRYQTGVSNYELSVVADVKVRIWSRLWANIRYQYSLKNNRTVIITDPASYPRTAFTRKQFNNLVAFRLVWIFNQERVAGVPREQP